MASIIVPGRRTRQPLQNVVVDPAFKAIFAFNATAISRELVNNLTFSETHGSLHTSTVVDRLVGLKSENLFAAGLSVLIESNITKPCILSVTFTPANTNTSGELVNRWVAGGVTSSYSGTYLIRQENSSLIFAYHDGEQKTWTLPITLVAGAITTIVLDIQQSSIVCYINGGNAGELAWTMPNLGVNITSEFPLRLLGVGPGGAYTAFTGLIHNVFQIKRGNPSSLSLNPWQIFESQKRVIYFDVGAGGSTSISINNTLETFTSSLDFSVSPVLRIENTLDSIVNSLTFSVSPGVSISNTLDTVSNNLAFSISSPSPELVITASFADTNNSLFFSTASQLIVNNFLAGTSNSFSFSVSPVLSISQLFNNLNNSFSLSVSPNIAVANSVEGLLNSLQFSVGGFSSLELQNSLTGVGNSLNFSVSPRLLLNNNLLETANNLVFSIEGAAEFSINQSFSSLTNNLVFSISPLVSISNNLGNFTNTLSFSVAGVVIEIPLTITAINMETSFSINIDLPVFTLELSQ